MLACNTTGILFQKVCDRYGNFHPQILAILRDQEEKCDRLAGVLYSKCLAQEQVSDVFDQLYGQHYSKSSISSMAECVSLQVSECLDRGLEGYFRCCLSIAYTSRYIGNAQCRPRRSTSRWLSRGQAGATSWASSTFRLKVPPGEVRSSFPSRIEVWRTSALWYPMELKALTRW